MTMRKLCVRVFPLIIVMLVQERANASILIGSSPSGDTFGVSSASQYDLQGARVDYNSGLLIELQFLEPVPIQLSSDGTNGLVLAADFDFGIGGVDPVPVELGLASLSGFESSLRVIAMDGDTLIFDFPGGGLSFLGAGGISLLAPDTVQFAIPDAFLPASVNGLTAATFVAGNELEATDWMVAQQTVVPEPSAIAIWLVLGISGFATRRIWWNRG